MRLFIFTLPDGRQGLMFVENSVIWPELVAGNKILADIDIKTVREVFISEDRHTDIPKDVILVPYEREH